ncbi:hypothetical protein CTM_20886, partial [Clostridium tetanomorphum DSM 665]
LSSTGVASWNDVNNETGYEVQLYKDGNPQGTAVQKAASVLNHDFIADMRAAGPGVYTVKVTAKGDGTNYSDGPQSLASGSQTIAKLTTVNAGLNWSGDIAHWNILPNAVSYDVQLYKDGNPINAPVNILAANAASGADFASAIAVEGGGTYTYKVTAKADPSSLFLDADQSSASNNNIKTIQLLQVTNVVFSSIGVATWDNVANESGYEVKLYKNGSFSGMTGTPGVDTTNYNLLSFMRAMGVGEYTVTVKAKGNGSTYSDGPQSAVSNSQSIVKLATVTDGLIWSGNTAHWTTVANAASYDVQLYKDGNPLSASVNVLAGDAVSGADFSSAIALGGGGNYTYKVIAKGDGVLLLDADQSASSNGNSIATPLSQVTGVALSSTGVASWNDVNNETGYEVQLYKDGNHNL